jgi:hypothetical protein
MNSGEFVFSGAMVLLIKLKLLTTTER